MKAKGLKQGMAYAYVHFALEVICFFYLTRYFKSAEIAWTAALFYDVLAFAPQTVIGAFCESRPGFHPGITGAVLVTLAAVTGVLYQPAAFVCLIILAIGNGFVHISGALVTLRESEGTLSAPAIFVAGGSFGVIAGKMLSLHQYLWITVILMGIAVAVMVVNDRKLITDRDYRVKVCSHDIARDYNAALVIGLLFVVVAVRSYMAYGIPTTWNRSVMQTLALYCAMGAGKALGGIAADLAGPKKTAITSTILALPFLLLGSSHMYISLIGVLLFSMTMAITLGGIVSRLKSNPGTAFGITTLGLLAGTLPVLFFGAPKGCAGVVVLVVSTVVAAVCLAVALKGKI